MKEDKKKIGRPRRQTPRTDVAFTIRVESDLLEKMRAISRQTNTPLKYLIDAAFAMAITNFEAKNGPIHTDAKNLDANALFQREEGTNTTNENGH